VQRNWHLTIQSDRIVTVRILRREPLALPSSVATYVRATNGFEPEGLLATFVDDALVNDRLSDYWGKAEIREWSSAARPTMYVVNVVGHYRRSASRGRARAARLETPPRTAHLLPDRTTAPISITSFPSLAPPFEQKRKAAGFSDATPSLQNGFQRGETDAV
jgi:hypothetical protein